MSKRYKNPPIMEVIFEVNLSQDTSWDLAVPGLIYEKIKDRFPVREPRVVQEVNFVSGPDGIKQEVRTSERTLFFQNDRKMLVQVGPRIISLHSLKFYPGWDNFKSVIEDVYKALNEVVSIKGLERLALRYINRIDIRGERIEPSDFFEVYIHLGKNLPQDIVNFNLECIFPFEEGRDLCKLQLFSPRPPIPPQNVLSLFLDIVYFLANPGSVKSEEVLEWTEKAHKEIERIFEGSITDRLREQFERSESEYD
jgi:uncharacterized protein (TIGR04255 family)